MPDDVARSELNQEKTNLIQQMRAGAVNALARCNWIHSTQIEALQAVVIYLITVCRDQVSRAHSGVVAAAIRAAEGMGLHEDGTFGNFTAITTHTRRLVWYQLLVLDIRTCEATGPRPQTRKGDFTTQIPPNIDEELIQNNTVASHKWTNMTATIIRFKCNEFIRDVWSHCLRLKDGKSSINEVLIKIRTFEAQMQGTFEKMANSEVPIQNYSCLVARILVSGTYAMVLRPYTIHPEIQMSDNLKKIFINNGFKTMDAVRELETAQDLVQWRWLFGAIQQHQNAVAMLLELLKNPYINQAIQIVKGLDYLFSPPEELESTPLIRIRWMATQLRDHMDFYARRHQSVDSQGVHGLRDVPELDHFDSSTCSSSATPGNASPNTQSSQSDRQQPIAASLHSVATSTRSSKTSRPDQVSAISAFPNQAYQNHGDFRVKFIDIDSQILRRYFASISETNLTMTAEERHMAYKIDDSSNISSPDQHTKEDVFDENYIDDAHISSCSPQILGACTDETLEGNENLYPNFYNIDDFTGYCENPPFTAESPVIIPAPSRFSNQQAIPFNDNLSRVPSEQAVYNGPELHDQQYQQNQPLSTFSPHAQNQHEYLFLTGNDVSTQPFSHSQIAQREYYQQLPESMDYSVPTYDTTDVRHFGSLS